MGGSSLNWWTPVSCNIALMSFARAPSLNNMSAANEVSGTGVTSWARIVEGIADLMENCVVREGTGGAVTILSGEWIRAYRESLEL